MDRIDPVIASEETKGNDEARRLVAPPRLGLLARLHRIFIRFLLFRCHRIELNGKEAIDGIVSGQRLVLIPNHVSHFDGVMWGCLLPEQVVTTINSQDSRKGYPAWLVRNHRVAVMDARTSKSFRTLVKILRGGATCLVFPEGRVTRTGDLHKVNPGAGMLAELADAALVPAWVEGPQLTRFSYLRGRVRRRLFPPFRITFMPPRRLEVENGLDATARRDALVFAIEGMMEEARVHATFRSRSLYEQFCDVCERVVPSSSAAIDDDMDRKITFARLLKAARAAAYEIRDVVAPGRFVGIIPEPTSRGVAVLFGLQAVGLPTLILDATMSLAQMAEACRAVEAKVVFASASALDAKSVQHFQAYGIRVVFLDDIAHRGIDTASRRRRLADEAAFDPKTPCLGFVCLDSAGAPEITLLSHDNVLANRAQAEARLSYVPGETVFSSAPLHTAEGLLAGVLLPLLSGCKIVLRTHPLSPKFLPASLSVACASVLIFDPGCYAAWLANADPLDATYIRRLLVTGPVRPASRHECLEKLTVRPEPVLTNIGATCFVAAHRVSEPGGAGFGPLLSTFHADPVPDGIVIHGPSVALGVVRPSQPGVVEPFPAHGLTLTRVGMTRPACNGAGTWLIDMEPDVEETRNQSSC